VVIDTTKTDLSGPVTLANYTERRYIILPDCKKQHNNPTSNFFLMHTLILLEILWIKQSHLEYIT